MLTAMAYYRNRETDIVQWHPQSGLGDFFNSDEIGEDGKPVKPFVTLPITPEKIKDAKSLMKADDSHTPAVNSDAGSSKKQEGEQ